MQDETRRFECGSEGSRPQGGTEEGSEGLCSDEPRGKKKDSVNGREGPVAFIYFLETEDGQYVKIGYSQQ
jgi:hypothetical protein